LQERSYCSEACDLPVHFFSVTYSQYHYVFVHECINNSIIANSILAEACKFAFEDGIGIGLFRQFCFQLI
jgi:hypothetical protein